MPPRDDHKESLPARRITHDTIELSQFGIRVPIVRVEGAGDYLPLRALCTAVGIASQPQVERVQEDPDYKPGGEQYDVPTAGGVQPAVVCPRRREVAWWLGDMDPRLRRKLEARFSTTLGEFKQALMDAADALWWGVRCRARPARSAPYRGDDHAALSAVPHAPPLHVR